MRAIIFTLLLAFTSPTVLAFAKPTPLNEQVKKADTIIRVVVVSATMVDNTEEFTALAKCRVVSRYKGGERLKDYIYIPIQWGFDPDPSPLDLEGEYIVLLETLEQTSIGHPVSYDAVYSINKGQVMVSGSSLKVDDFGKKIKALMN